MASDTQETLYEIFAGLAGGSVSGARTSGGGLAGGAIGSVSEMGGSVSEAGGSVSGAGGSGGSLAGGAIGSVSGAVASGGGMAGGVIGSAISAVTGEPRTDGGGAAGIALKIVKSGLGAVPLVAALLGLFGGSNDDEKPAPLVKYALPERREFLAAATGLGFAEVDYDQAGMPRVYERQAGATPLAARPTASQRESGAAVGLTASQRESGAAVGLTASQRESGAAVGLTATPERAAIGALPPIVVNVQAMDARSFLDRSSEIAAAVREAMLNLNSINDVVTDL